MKEGSDHFEFLSHKETMRATDKTQLVLVKAPDTVLMCFKHGENEAIFIFKKLFATKSNLEIDTINSISVDRTILSNYNLKT